MKNLKLRTQKGFTIIEVMIVLAIAGLIMGIVFIAVPALQRSSHNTQRRSDASHLASIINEYASNHAGTLPTGFGTGAGQVDVSGENWAIMVPPFTIVVNAATTPTGTTSMNVNEGYTCNPATNALSAGSLRNFAVTYNIETSGGSQAACLSD